MSYLKNELSNKSKWKISKHRYLELVHYCLQYSEWRKELGKIDILRASSMSQSRADKEWIDQTSEIVIRRAELINRIEQIERITREADPDLASYIFISVTKGTTYPQLSAFMYVPCSRDTFYDRRRKFYWLLNKVRG